MLHPGINGMMCKCVNFCVTCIKFVFTSPLWQRNIPPYPIYQAGDPQLRVFLPLFWMKVIRPKYRTPPDMVHFEVHHQ